MFRVTYFSFWQSPQHHEDVDAGEVEDLALMGKHQQYKVVVTSMDEEPPENYL